MSIKESPHSEYDRGFSNGWNAARAQPAQAVPQLTNAFLADVMTAAGLVTHGKQCKALGARLGSEVARLRMAGAAAPKQAEAVPAHRCTGAGDTALGTKADCPFCAAPQQAEAVPPTEQQIEAACDAVAAALGDAYDCTRAWSAWSYGTMGPEDFSQVSEDDDRVREIALAALGAAGLKVAP